MGILLLWYIFRPQRKLRFIVHEPCLVLEWVKIEDRHKDKILCLDKRKNEVTEYY